MTGFLRIALRVLWRQRLYTALNVAGLAIGLTAAMLILLQVAYERSFNTQFANGDRIHQITRTIWTPGQPLFPVWATQLRLGPAMAEAFPEELEAVVRTGWTPAAIRKDGVPLRQFILLTDPDYFRLFERKVIAGDPVQALSRPSQAVLTVEAARRFFGDADPMGRTLDLVDGPALTVAAVVASLPANTSIPRSGVFTSFETPLPVVRRDNGWGSNWVSLFVMLRPGVAMETVEARFPEFLARTVPDFEQPGGDTYSYWLRTVPLANQHLGPHPDQPTSLRDGLNQITLLAGLVVLIAIINFVNLATARSGLRAREVALRKTLGARRGALMVQFVGESVLIALLAGIVTLALVELLQPAFSAFIDRTLDPSWGTLELQLAVLAPLVLAAGILGGLWPGVVLSAFKPAHVFRNAASGGGGGGRLRQVLVIGQFAAAIALGIAAWVMWAQFQHGSTQRLGFDKEDVVLWRGLESVKDAGRLRTLVDRFRAEPTVVEAALAAWVPGDGSDRSSTMVVPEDPARTPHTLRVESADHEYLRAMGARLLAGRLFDPARADDLLIAGRGMEERRAVNVVVSRETVRFLAWGTPEQALGRTLLVGGDPDTTTLTVVGVVEDFQFYSAQRGPSPTVFTVDLSSLGTLAVRMEPGSGPADLERLDALFREVLPDTPVVRDFLEERIRALHNRENLYGRLFGLLAVLAILIANLGLFGLAAFTAERRTKEIGLRKALGAESSQIVRLLIWQFSHPVIIAWLIATPVAWFGLDAWLSVYANRIVLTPVPFLVAGGVAIAFAWLTVAGHAARVAARRPIHALRYE